MPSFSSPGSARSPMPRERIARSSPGIDKGPMHGIPYAQKDIYATAGIRTTCHSKLLIDNVPAEDCVGRGKVQGRRRGAARQARHARVRARRAELRSAVPARAQSMEPRSFHRRSSSGSGAGGRRGLVRVAHGLRHRRLDPRAGLLLRHCRAQADLWTGVAARRVPSLLHARPLRPAELDGGGRGPHHAGDRRLRSARPGQRDIPTPDFTSGPRPDWQG